MAKKELNNGCNCIEYGVYVKSKSIQKMLLEVFNKSVDYTNGFVKYVWSEIYKIAEKDTELKTSLNIIKNQNKLYGNALYKKEQDEVVTEAQNYIRKIIYKDKLISFKKLLAEYKKLAPKIYSIYLPDDVRYNLLENKVRSFDDFINGKGKNVKVKPYSDLNAIRYKPMHPRNKDTNLIDYNKKQGGMQLIQKGKDYYIKIYDTRPEKIKYLLDVIDFDNNKVNTKNGYLPKHKYYLCLKIHYNEKDLLQKQLLDGIDKGALKLKRLYKKGKWTYRLQINFEQMSPVISNIKFGNVGSGKLAINSQTETLAYCDMVANQGLVEYTPTTPRTTKVIDDLNRKLDRSRKCTNSKMYNKDGTIKYNKRTMVELGLEWYNSNTYIKTMDKLKEEYRVNTAKRKLNNYTLIKNILTAGKYSDIIVDNNAFRNWGAKQCRMSKKSKERISRSVRVNDYTKQIHDRAPAMCIERIKSICNQLDVLNFNEVNYFNVSTYNPFTDDFDIFLTLDKRLVVFDLSTVSEAYNNRAIDFVNTFTKVYDGEGNSYILQRDVFGASKMLFLHTENEERVSKKGNKYIVKVSKFDRDAYLKWFKNVFYPKHLELINDLIRQYNLGIDLNGTILGSK